MCFNFNIYFAFVSYKYTITNNNNKKKKKNYYIDEIQLRSQIYKINSFNCRFIFIFDHLRNKERKKERKKFRNKPEVIQKRKPNIVNLSFTFN